MYNNLLAKCHDFNHDILLKRHDNCNVRANQPGCMVFLNSSLYTRKRLQDTLKSNKVTYSLYQH